MSEKKESGLNVPFLPMKKVLIAIDYNPSAQKVAEIGYQLAKSMNAEVSLLHILANDAYYSTLEPTPAMGFGNFTTAEFFIYVNKDGLKKAAQYYLESVANHLNDPSVQTILAEGDFANEIMIIAKATGADLIVMGSHSRRWVEQILIGSVTEKVLRKSEIPLFIIPTKEQ
jgi:nucleotide-binding universal stress UspA family protein